jgi:hypothetical protein
MLSSNGCSTPIAPLANPNKLTLIFGRERPHAPLLPALLPWSLGLPDLTKLAAGYPRQMLMDLM